MKTQKEIEQEIDKVKFVGASVLKGDLATIQINAPRALLQLEAETSLRVLHWVLGKKYISQLKA